VPTINIYINNIHKKNAKEQPFKCCNKDMIHITIHSYIYALTIMHIPM